MANELIKVELTNSTGFPRRYTVANATAISKGTLLTLTDPRTAIAVPGTATAAVLNIGAGVAAEDKEASDGLTSISVWTDGIFEAKASGAIAVGAGIVPVAGNCVAQAPAATLGASGAHIIGYALEAASADEVINVRIRL